MSRRQGFRAAVVLVAAAAPALVAAAPAAAAPVPPTAAMSFSPAGIQPNGVSLLTITLANPNANAASGVAFTDSLPANVTVASPSGLTSTCGGTATASPNSS